MKKIKFVIFNIIIIILIAVFSAYAFDIKNIFTSAPAPSKTAPAVKQTPVKNPAPPVKASNVAPAAAPNPNKNTVPPAPASVAPIPAPAPVDNYSYNPSGKPDPFLPFIMVEILRKKKIESKEKEAVFSIFPLQRAEAEKYRVVGIAGDKDHRVAIVEDAAKKFYPLLLGTRIGLHNGKVIEVMADRVIVEEYENKKAKRIILKLRKN
jgi:type IV pilus assembly protein PilP